MLAVVHVIVLTLHLLAASVATAAPFFCLWLAWRADRTGDQVADRAGQYLAVQTLVMLAAAVALGLALLGLVWLRHADAYGHGLRVLSDRIMFGVAELFFSAVCFGIYRAGWQRMKRRWLHAAVGFVGATNLAYHFPTLFIVIGAISTRPDLWEGKVNFVALMLEPENLARLAHFGLACFAVVGVVVIAFAARLGREGEEAAAVARLSRAGGLVALAAVALQMLVGMFLLMQLPESARNQLLGHDVLATSLLAATVLAAIGLLYHLLAAALGDTQRRQHRPAMILLIVVMFAMVAARERTHESRYQRIEARPPASGTATGMPA